MTRSREDFERVLGLVGEGLNDCEIARRTSLPRSTVRDWRLGRAGTAPRWAPFGSECGAEHEFSGLPATSYTYLLGMYLGDGCLSQGRRDVWRLRITADRRYTRVIDECSAAMQAVMPTNRASRIIRSSRCVDISMYSKHWPCLFPQHGPGRKHDRAIYLEPWQEALVDSAAESFVRGLIHSDGCRIVVSDRGVASVRYHFSNRSEDIKRMLCTRLDQLGIRWTRPNDRGIAVYRKDAVARLDSFVGPKR